MNPIDWLLSFVGIGKTGFLVGAAVAIIGGLGYIIRTIKKAGVNEQKAKEADAYEKHLNEIARSAAARPRGSVHGDPYNRDNNKRG